MNEGDIILANILTSQGIYKKRPALILKVLPKYNDFLICGISTQLHQSIDDLDFLLNPYSSDFSTTGLLKESVIRLSYISVIPNRFVEGKIGKISKESYKLLIHRFCDFLLK